jgi:cytochrome c peroxidase
MRLINTRFAQEKRFFWDERAPTLEHQATQPIQDHVEMGFSGTGGDPDFAALTVKLSAIPEYRVLFSMVFGDASITEERVQKSIAQFVRSIQSFDSKYDAGRAVVTDEVNFPNFTSQENTGKLQFMRSPEQGGAGCAACHIPPTFDIDPASGNNGVVGKIGGGQDLTNTRAPSLRDLLGPGGPNGPFMHDGSMAGLGQITNHYRGAIPDNPTLDPRLRRPALPFRNSELAPLRAFLHTLTGTAVYNDPKWSSPFDESGELQVIVLPFEAIRIERNSETSSEPPVLRGQLAPNLDYRIEFSTSIGETNPWQTLAAVRSDANGLVEYSLPSEAGKMFYRFVYDVPTN